MKKVTFVLAIFASAALALAGCHHNKPANNEGSGSATMGSDTGSGSAEAGSGSAMGSGDMGSGGGEAGSGGSGGM